MILLILGLVDIFAGVTILFPETFSSLALILGVTVLLKGIFSFGSAVLNSYWLDWMGILDIITGIFLLTGFSIQYFWILPLIKGLYTILRHYAGQNYL